MSTRWEHPREWCLFCGMRSPKKIALKIKAFLELSKNQCLENETGYENIFGTGNIITSTFLFIVTLKNYETQNAYQVYAIYLLIEEKLQFCRH